MSKDEIIMGRPSLEKSKKRKIKVSFYINDIEAIKFERLKIQLLNSSPPLSHNDFFRLVIMKHDDTLLDFLNLSIIDDVKQHMRSKRVYSSIFEDN